jgi:hypothetical protein
VLILALLGLWAYQSTKPFDLVAYLILGAVVLISGFQIYFRIRSYQNEKSGLSAEDELSLRIRERAAANSFKFSVFMWVFAELFLVEKGMPAPLIVGLGVLAMGLIFVISWFYFTKVGIANDHKN